MEDILTSNVLSMFRYLNDLTLPAAFLRKAKNLKDENLILSGLNKAQVLFWPKFCFPGLGYREPDGLLLLEVNDGSRIAIVIEAKYDSGLSNIENESKEDSSAVQNDSFLYGHQLADQYCGIFCGRWDFNSDILNEFAQAGKKALIYLTAHYEFPKDDIKDAAEAIEKRNCKEKNALCLENADCNIYWVGWRDLYTLIGQYISQYTGGERNYLEDLRDILEGRYLEPFQQPFMNLVELDIYDQLLGEKAHPFKRVDNLKPFNSLTAVGVYRAIFNNSVW